MSHQSWPLNSLTPDICWCLAGKVNSLVNLGLWTQRVNVSFKVKKRVIYMDIGRLAASSPSGCSAISNFFLYFFCIMYSFKLRSYIRSSHSSKIIPCILVLTGICHFKLFCTTWIPVLIYSHAGPVDLGQYPSVSLPVPHLNPKFNLLATG